MAAPTPKLHVDRSGIVRATPQIPSPNFDERPPGTRITLLVVHAISLPPGEFGGPWIVELFTNRLNTAAHPYFASLEGQKLSAHFLIRREGSIAQFVPCALRAWHAGLSSWRGRDQCNDYSMGIELEGTDDIPYTDLQYAALAALTRALSAGTPSAMSSVIATSLRDARPILEPPSTGSCSDDSARRVGAASRPFPDHLSRWFVALRLGAHLARSPAPS